MTGTTEVSSSLVVMFKIEWSSLKFLEFSNLDFHDFWGFPGFHFSRQIPEKKIGIGKIKDSIRRTRGPSELEVTVIH